MLKWVEWAASRFLFCFAYVSGIWTSPFFVQSGTLKQIRKTPKKNPQTKREILQNPAGPAFAPYRWGLRLIGRLCGFLPAWNWVQVESGLSYDSSALSRMPVMTRMLLTLVLSAPGTNHFYCQSILGPCPCGNKSFFQSSVFNLGRVCVWGVGGTYINALFLTCLACFGWR